ncbi:hypothetical protein A2415_02710 [candidate division WWE3 bacterium RIFOXYC1_FULL_39_7]|uniref:Uncharacterized protein n=2 Tax=Katanobacteria TaxID=422282 RepID=A0A1F4X4U0_UNCKA|nr:MAG: hypothetical protein A2415_02710 [candidate division WWE3 bacterium RIFOXYC1_FULL_39_7]OGC76636.1 MAG: hypothetical protein A2619_04270 [candidate division WWE3 bacterium RIFOXYD1_FULL_39_9]
MSSEFQQRDPAYEVPQDEPVPEWIINEALLINEAIDKGKVTTIRAEAARGEEGAIFENKEILEVMKNLVEPCFYIEYPPENLEGQDRGSALLKMFKSKFTDESGKEWEIGDYMADKNEAVSICMSTLDESTAEAIRYLNEKKVPVVAWVVVEDAEGYWTNKTNIKETTLKTDQILEWAKEHDIHLRAVGFDMEKPVNFLSNIAQANIVEMAKALIEYKKNVAEAAKNGDPQVMFDALLHRLNEEGVETEIYTFPRGMKGLLGGMEVTSPDNKRIIEMVYTNGIPTGLQGGAFKLLRSESAIPAFGIASGDETETPGRDFARISEANRTGQPLLEVEKGPIPKHLSEEELGILIDAWLDQEINIGDRTFKSREMYLFAMNNARVALMLSNALEAAFDKQKEKAK